MKRFVWIAGLLALQLSSVHAVIPPRDGSMPSAYHEARRLDPHAMRLSHAWIQKAQRAREAREAFLQGASLLSSAPIQVSGVLAVPVLPARFVGTAAPITAAALQGAFFDGPSLTGTINDYYSEVSYGAFEADGIVFEWVELSKTDVYYEGTSNGLLPGDARTGELIREVLNANDATVDFGAFDNDGPDGIPNSGDDDGFVDLLVVLHNQSGGECGNGNIWSHTGDYRFWPISGGNAYVTGDPSLSGGFIKVQDYAIHPARSCGGGAIEIGGLCHSLGHALGLPDLFDPDGPTNGIGRWGLMGLGAWNQPASPAHPTAWSRQEMGWLIPESVGATGSIEMIGNIETTATAFKLSFTDDRFVRVSDCALSGSYAMRCGLDAQAATVRAWSLGEGYGNNWDEVVQHDFTYDGTSPVMLEYAFSYDLETGYDTAYVSVVAAGTEIVLTTYGGVAEGTETIDLTGALSALTAPAAYTVRFRVATDAFGSDEDGKYDSRCGAMVIDDITLVGGGESYFSGFETSVDGWYQDATMNTPTEYWLVENRQPIGYDQHLIAPGLLIWHVDEQTVHSNIDSIVAKGLVLEEADGVGHLHQNPGNTGDAGDPFPGATNNRTFDAGSTPASARNTGRATMVEVSGIGAPGSPMTAFLTAGDPAPRITGVVPSAIENDQTAALLVVEGLEIQPGATFYLAHAGEGNVVPVSVFWEDRRRIEGSLNVYDIKGGAWDVVVVNPDGQAVTLAEALEVVDVVPAEVVFASILVLNDGVEIQFQLYDRDPGETVMVSRSDEPDGPWFPLGGEVEEVSAETFRFVDRNVSAGRTYYYRVDARTANGEVRRLYSGVASLPAREVRLDPNYPNPFNPSTVIRYYLPERLPVTVEIYDAGGARIRALASGVGGPGTHRIEWDGRDGAGKPVASGVYFCRLQAGKRTLSRKVILLR